MIIPIKTAPTLKGDSWLQEPEYDNFRSAYSYACTQTRFIEATNGLNPEKIFWIHEILQAGFERLKNNMQSDTDKTLSNRSVFLDHKVFYINSQEEWWGNYNPNYPKGDDISGDGSVERPFKTLVRAFEEFKRLGIKSGSVRAGIALVGIWP